ncbi:MAG: HYExAFE family protein [Planctomycetota bacterium]
MANRRFHYDRAFEHFLRANTIAYVAVDEAKRALSADRKAKVLPTKLKSFDFVVYSQSGANLLVDVKGRKLANTTGRGFQNWVTEDDVSSLTAWSEIFGDGFEPVFVFLFWCDSQPADALFHEVMEYGERWYAVRAVKLSAYREVMRPRSAKWGTVSVPAKAFEAMAGPLGDLL